MGTLGHGKSRIYQDLYAAIVTIEEFALLMQGYQSGHLSLKPLCFVSRIRETEDPHNHIYGLRRFSKDSPVELPDYRVTTMILYDRQHQQCPRRVYHWIYYSKQSELVIQSL